MLHIRQLAAAEVPLLKDFPPREWQADLPVLFGRHFGQPYFYPIVAELDGTLVGCANGLLNGNAGWLGNIIVLPAAREHGIGTALTQHLVDFFHAKGVAAQLLIATPMGEPIYRRLGFETVSSYLFFSRPGAAPAPTSDSTVRAMAFGDQEAVFALDGLVSGEERQRFLARCLDGGWVHASPSGAADGYHLPCIGNGLVIASNDGAGLALMRWKLSMGARACVVPEANRVAAEFLRDEGFVEASRAPRMALGGADVNWHAEHVYCRGSGFCG
ncbi:MAG TPA: GNAT family N-acetyltransferase [Anaerolineales bacterium]